MSDASQDVPGTEPIKLSREDAEQILAALNRAREATASSEYDQSITALSDLLDA